MYSVGSDLISALTTTWALGPKKEGTRGLVAGSSRGNALLARNDQKAVEA